jgi:uncharacterized protein (DUF58 family)
MVLVSDGFWLKMTPSPRLIWLVAAVGFPLALIAAVFPGTLVSVMVALVIFCCMLIGDLVMRRRSLEGVRVELPSLVRAFQDQAQEIPVRIHNPLLRTTRLRLGLVAPDGTDAEWEEQAVQMPADAALAEFPWKLLPRKRGKMIVNASYLEALSPLGLWNVRRSDAARLEVRVYPNLRKDPGLRAIRQGHEGVHHMRQVGRGREFEKLREYVAGDSSDEIHWKATARRGRPVTKVFQVERTQEIYVIIDASRLSGRVVENEPALDRAIRAALLIGAAAERRGDLFGLAGFSDKVEAFARARSGKSHYAACRDAINEIQTRQRAPDFEEIATFLRLRLQRRALLIFLTALDEQVMADEFVRATGFLAKQHLILTGMLRPPSVRPLFQNPEVKSAGDIYQELAGHLALRHLRELEATLARNGVRFALLEPQSYATRLIGFYDEMKQRQLL